MQKLVSIELQAHFGFLKKPDINVGMYLTYNMLHKPALLGILGAIAGLSGYSNNGAMNSKDVPEYRQKLKDLKVAIIPLNAINGSYGKEVIKYTNTVGYASEEQGGVLIIDEQTLIKPNYQVFLLLNEENSLHSLIYNRLKNFEAEYIPYLGKNDHQVWWENFMEWEWEEFKPVDSFQVNSIFLKDQKVEIDIFSDNGSFMYFENLPYDFQINLPHYELKEFIFTDYNLSDSYILDSLLRLNNGKVIQIF